MDESVRSVRRLALVLAGFGLLLVALRATGAFDIYCDGSRVCWEALIATTPTYVAMLGLTLGALLIALRLRESRAHAEVAMVVVAVARLASLAFVVMAVAAYDEFWSMFATTATLDDPGRTRLLPLEVLDVATAVWRAAFATWIVTASVWLSLRVLPRVWSVVGGAIGLTFVAAATIRNSDTDLLYVAWAATTLWAIAVVILLSAMRRAAGTAR